MKNFKILGQFENSPDMLGTFHRQKTADKTFLPADQERTPSAHMTAVYRALSPEQN